ncbi:unnamed protein product [Prorocentrum cordatum]|uniref:Uncharacterized protein n=1 Tax=Prorocentrum cordatum TaxID=2364126 RepID=A0ABN9TD57_9DINO|nr:unnamed protein product [Polarella glacialis]
MPGRLGGSLGSATGVCPSPILVSAFSLGHGIAMRPEDAGINPDRGEDAYFVDCQLTPWMCEAPFDCIEANENVSDLWRLRWKVAGWDGHSNPKSWCVDDTFWQSTVKECLIDAQPKKAAASRRSLQLSRGGDDEDAKYCFLEKHCVDDEINEHTTAEQAEAACTKRYGDRWKRTGLQDFYTGLKKDARNTSYVFGEAGSLMASRRAAAKSRIACAQGSFHCDVVYCKEAYCSDGAYRSRYAKYLSWDSASD